MTEQHDLLPAGRFSSWLADTVRAHAEAGEVDVHCGTCTACCRAAYFIHVQPDETETLRRIPKALLFPAPGLPKGNVLMGYDEHGHCPMLVDGGCSIYEHRPRTCRAYDCRIFAAAGLRAGDPDEVADDGPKAEVDERVRRWSFQHETPLDHRQHAAVRAAAAFVQEHPEVFGDGPVPRTTSQVAIVALKVHAAFLPDEGAGDVDVDGADGIVTPSVDAVRAALHG